MIYFPLDLLWWGEYLDINKRSTLLTYFTAHRSENIALRLPTSPDPASIKYVEGFCSASALQTTMPLHHRNSNGVIHPSSSLAETQPQTTLSFVTSPQIPLYTRFLTFLRLFYLFLIAENPLWWSFRQGARNKQADLEGPYYVVGAPDRTIARGKAALASLNDLQGASLGPLISCADES